MPRRDVYHFHIREALVKDGWTITADPLDLSSGGVELYADLGAERVLAAERGEEKIMGKIKKYQTALISLLNEYAEFLTGSNAPVKPQIFIDKDHNHFQLLKIGWDSVNEHFVFGILFHFDIIDDKIWLQLNNTEFPVVDELIEHGVPKSDIVLGFQPPIIRQQQQNIHAELV